MTLHKVLASVVIVMAIGSATAIAELPDNAVWIDVRSPAEYAEGHLEEAVLIPFDGIETGIQRLKLQPDAPIYLYCGSGGRAEMARQRLQARGFTNVTNVGGLHDARALTAGEPVAP